MPVSNGVVAGRVIGAALVGIGLTGACGLWLHNYTMAKANDYERKLAVKCGWDLSLQSLHAFDEKHPNNQSPHEQAQIKLMREKLNETNRQQELDIKEGRLRRFALNSRANS